MEGLGQGTYTVPDILTGQMASYSASSPAVAGAGGGGVSYERPKSWKYAPYAYRYDRLHLIWSFLSTNETRVLVEQQFPRLSESQLSALKQRISAYNQALFSAPPEIQAGTNLPLATETITRLPAAGDSVVPMATPPTTAAVIQQQVAQEAGVVTNGAGAGTEPSLFSTIPTWAWLAGAGVGAYLLFKGGK
jgi:hypothetical protein